MSHLHIPDGLLPVWLWVSGLAAALLLLLACVYAVRGIELKKKVPLLGMMSAMMLVGMNLEVVPIAYHVNLSVVTGIIVGPWLAVIASFIVSLLMALVGHGGITVVGLNTLVLGAEGILGFTFFRVFRRFMKPFFAAAAATMATLFITTCMMLVIVLAANVDFTAEAAHGLREVMESPSASRLGGLFRVKESFNFAFFAYAALGLGLIGWCIEALVGAVAVRFISRVKPELLG